MRRALYIADIHRPEVREGIECIEHWAAAGGLDNPSQRLWLDIEGDLTEADADLLRGTFRLHPMAIEDAQRTRHPPKFEAFEDHYFVLLRGLASSRENLVFSTVQIALFAGANFLVSRHNVASVSVDAAWENLRKHPELAKSGFHQLVPRIGRTMVDRYIRLLLTLEPRLEQLEADLLDDPSPDQLTELTTYKSRLKKLRRVFTYHEQVFSALRGSSIYAGDRELTHLANDTFEQLERANSLSALYYDLASDLVDSSISLASHRLNGIMKVLTIITAIFVPLSFLAGIYGMNFQHIPELASQHGYFVLLGVMGTIALGCLAIFRYKKWL